MSGRQQRREERKVRRIKYVKRTSFRNYIRGSLKIFGSHASIASTAVEVVNSILFDLFFKVATEAKELMAHKLQRTLMAKHFQTAAELIFKGEVSRHAISHGCNSVLRYVEQTRRR